jgi:hypothetical protein
VVDLTAAMDVLAVVDFEEGDTLIAAFQKALPVTFMIDFHADEINVEFRM